MTLLGWTTTTLAERLGCEHYIVEQWADGTVTHRVPEEVAEWILQHVNIALRLPPPQSWRTRGRRQSYNGKEHAAE